MNRRFLRRVAIVVAAAIGVLLLAGVIFTATFDVNRYKPQIESAVKERTGRTLRFDGDLALTLFPRLAVKLPPTTLSERGRDTVFARLQSAQASVALLPLLHRQIEVDGVRIDGLQATVVRHKDGTTSIDDLLQSQKGAAPAGKAEPASTGGAGASIGAVQLKNADVTWRDLAAGREVRLNGLDLRAGRYAPGARMPIEASAAVTSNEPALAAKLDFKADIEWTEQGGLGVLRELSLKADGTLKQQPVTIDAKADQLRAAADALDVRGLKLMANAKQAGAPLELQLTAPRLEAGPTRAAGERIEATFARRGNEPVDAKVLVDGVRGTAARLEATTVKITGSTRSAQRTTRFDMTTALVASVNDRTLALERANGEVMIEDPAFGRNPLRLPLSASGTVDAQRETVALQFETRGEGLNARGRINTTGFAAPRVAFDLDADQIDADRYFLSSTAKEGAGPVVPGRAAPAKAPPGTATPEPDTKVDLSALQGINAAGNVHIARLRIKGTDVADLKATLKANDGRVDVAPFGVRMHGGSISGRVGLDARSHRASIDGTASGIQLRQLAGTIGGRAAVEGSANGTFALATAGATVNQMKRALGGSLALEVRDGALVGIDLADLIGTAAGFLQSRGRQSGTLDENRRTPFSQLSASVRIKDGVATNDDLKGKSPQLDIAGSGRMDLVSMQIDYALRAQVLAGAATERTALRGFAGLTVPVKITGPVEHPAYAVDWGPIAAEALLKRATGRSGTAPVNEAIQGLGDLLRRKR